jgi:hypothetical protein
MRDKMFPRTKHLKMSGRSFQSGLISSLANFLDIVSDPHIKGGGEMDSSLRYQLLGSEQKHWIFNKLTH